ncbi:MAG: adenosylcobinamide-GDP ribazoletransferase [Salinigranum sp.]
MALNALRGAVGFLSRVPVGRDAAAWDAFRSTPTAFPLAGYLLGLALALPFVLPVAPPVAAFAFLAWMYVVTGVPHADAVADLGDAAVVHGDPAERRAVMTDTTVGVGAVLALGLVLAGLWSAAFRLAALPARPPSLAAAGVRSLGALPIGSTSLVVAAEVGAKLAMAEVACLGSASHDGLGSAVSDGHGPRSLVLPALVALPVAATTWPSPAAAVALLAAALTGLGVLWWATRRLGGTSGDVIGGANELARVAGLLAGVIAWTHL